MRVMGFENKTTDELLKIVRAGLGFTLNKNSMSAEDIERIMRAAAESGAKITFTDSDSLEDNSSKS